MKKILIITPTVYEYPERVGGAETYVDSLAFALSKIAKVKVIGFSRKKTGKRSIGQVNYKIYKSLPIKKNPSNPLPVFNFFEILLADIIYIQQYHTWLACISIYLARIFRKKIVLTDHNGGGPTYNRKLKLDRYIDLFLATSLLSFKEINLSPRKVVPIYGGVDLEHFTPGNFIKEGILFVGRAHRIKGIIPFLENVIKAKYNGIITLALGVNYDNEKHFQDIRNYIKENNLKKCVIKKNLPSLDLIQEYQLHNWTILPSIDELPHESLGLTALESLGCDTPVAVSPYCGVVELFNPVPGPFVHILTDQTYFLKHLSDESPRGGRLWSQTHASWDIVARKILNELEKI